MKKSPAKEYTKESGRKPILGLMADESNARRNAWMQTGCNAFDLKEPQSQPMAFWTEQDILQYLKKYNPGSAYVFGNGLANTLVAGSTPNPYLTWSTSRTYNVGVDFGFFDNRLTGTIDVFYKKESDILGIIG